MVPVIYIDTLFLINLIINYLLLLASAKLAGLTAKRLRLAAGALLGGVYAVLVYLPGLDYLSGVLVKIGVAAIMVIISFGVNKNTLRAGVVFFAVAFAFGGGVLAVWFFMQHSTGVGSEGIPYIHIDFKLLLLVAAGCYAVITLVFKGIARHTAKNSIAAVIITYQDKSIKLYALMDTGNALREPFTNAPVLVIEASDGRRLFPDDIASLMNEKGLSEPYELMMELSKTGIKPIFRLIPYKSVGTENGALLAFKPDSVIIGGREQKGCFVALSPTGISDGTGYTAIAGVS